MKYKFTRNLCKSKFDSAYKEIGDTNLGLIDIMEFSNKMKRGEGMSLLW